MLLLLYLGAKFSQMGNHEDAKIFKAAESNNLNYSDLESLDFMNIVFGR